MSNAMEGIYKRIIFTIEGIENATKTYKELLRNHHTSLDRLKEEVQMKEAQHPRNMGAFIDECGQAKSLLDNYIHNLKSNLKRIEWFLEYESAVNIQSRFREGAIKFLTKSSGGQENAD
jgi:hypothetical protein